MGWELRNSLVAGCWDTGIEWNDILPEVRKADRPGGREMSDETKKVKCLNCGEESKEKFCSMACALMRPDILEADAMIEMRKKVSESKNMPVR